MNIQYIEETYKVQFILQKNIPGRTLGNLLKTIIFLSPVFSPMLTKRFREPLTTGLQEATNFKVALKVVSKSADVTILYVNNICRKKTFYASNQDMSK